MSLPGRALGAIRCRAVARAVLALLSSAALSSCGVLLGDNVKGSFVCSAPGGTCAPSTLIDDQALALIESAQPQSPVSHRLVVRREVKANAVGSRAERGKPGDNRAAKFARVSDTLAHRDARTLRLVFPAFIDDAGNLHEARVVHTVVDQGGWIELTNGSLAPPVGYDAGDGEALPVPQAPHLPETSISDKTIGASSQEQPATSASPQSPTQSSPLTIDAIRAQVAERLAGTPRRTQHTAPAPADGSLQPISPHSPPEDRTERAAPVSAAPKLPVTATTPSAFSGPAGE